MNRKDAERIVTDMAKPVFAFAAQRCSDCEDAEDLSQEILYRSFRALLTKDDLTDPERFVWRIARNALANYYRGKARHGIGVPLDEIAEPAASEDSEETGEKEEILERLRGEIAFLSDLRRKIVVAYYFDHKKTAEIAQTLGIPAGTVKWHLFEARKELKERIITVRETEHLQFNPIEFTRCFTNGSVGTNGGCQNFFRSILSQNIAYSVYREAKTSGEIARDLGVSPVYVESEAEYLEEYGFLTRQGERYLANILINEPTEDECVLRERMVEKAAALIGDGLYDALISSGLMDDGDHIWGGISGEISMNSEPPRDRNLMLWALIPYLAALGGEAIQNREETVSFEEAATIRPEGGHNICEAWIEPPSKQTLVPTVWCGPCWNRWNGLTLWQVDSPWSGRRVTEEYQEKAARDLALLGALDGGGLRPEEYALLCERGYLTVVRDGTGIKTGFRCVWIDGAETKRKLIALGDRVKENCWEEIKKLKEPYVEAVMKRTPERLRKMQAFGLGYLFHSDGPFLYQCLKRLLDTGRLTAPVEEVRNSLSLLVIDERK